MELWLGGGMSRPRLMKAESWLGQEYDIWRGSAPPETTDTGPSKIPRYLLNR